MEVEIMSEEKTLIVAEKPNQAKDFYVKMVERNVPGEKFEMRQGYLESEHYYITWCIGHLLGIPLPDELDERYAEKGAGFKHLPIALNIDRVPYKFTDAGREAQAHVVMTLAYQSHTVVCATDPDREGQGIFSSLFDYYKIKRPRMLRLWAPSLTDDDLDKYWARMEDLSKYDGLRSAWRMRDVADWLVGMNGSRAAGAVVGIDRLAVGRVKTALLKIIVDRDKEVEDYKESFYFRLRGKWLGISFLYCQDNETEFETEAELQPIEKMLRGKKFRLSEFKEVEGVKHPPRPFSLPDLQKEANKKLKFSLQKTLDVLQDLYEAKLVTYPRTDSPYLPESDLAKYHSLVRRVATEEQKRFLVGDDVKPSCVKDTESAHTAIVITGVTPGTLDEDHRALYELIKDRFVVSFMRSNTYWQYSLGIKEDGGDSGSGKEWTDPIFFRASVKVHKDRGYLDCGRGVGEDEEDDEDDGRGRGNGQEEVMSERLDEGLFRGLSEALTGVDMPRMKRPKPKYYTPATLVTAMQRCGKNIVNPKYKKILTETRGIGTPATQSGFPEELKKSGLIEERNGHYCSTATGRKLVDLVPFKLKSPELSAEWELQLRLVESGDMSEDEFYRGLVAFVGEFVDEMRSREGKEVLPPRGRATGLKCPKCGGGIIDKGTTYVCENRRSVKDTSGKWTDSGCEVWWFKKFGGKDDAITVSVLGRLLAGKEVKIKGFVNKAGTKYEGMVVMNGENKIVMVGAAAGPAAVKKTTLECPFCGGGMVDFGRGYGCSDGDCGFKVFNNGNANITEAVLQEVFRDGVTAKEVEGHVRKSGSVYSARLVLNRELKKVETEREVREKTELMCPFCGKAMEKSVKGVFCANEGCKFVMWNQNPNVTESVCQELFKTGETKEKIGGFVSKKTGKPFSARLRLDREAKEVRYVFEDKSN
jgi:DNA topoisomerase-3